MIDANVVRSNVLRLKEDLRKDAISKIGTAIKEASNKLQFNTSVDIDGKDVKYDNEISDIEDELIAYAYKVKVIYWERKYTFFIEW